MAKLAKRLELTVLNRNRKSVEDWVAALKQADNVKQPKRAKLIEIYERIVLDTHLSAIIDNRKNKVTGEKFVIESPSGEVDEEATKLFRRPWFNKFCKHALDSIFYGYSLIELGELNELQELDSVTLIERRNVIPERDEVLLKATDQTGINYLKGALMDELIFVGDKYDYGLLNKAVPLVLYKAIAFGSWAQHTEIYAQPFRIAKTNLDDTDLVAQLEGQMQRMGTEGFALLNLGDEFEFLQAGQFSFQIYNNLIDACNAEISKLIQGQTMSSDNGSSQSQATVHKGVADEIAESDKEFLENVINEQLIPRLVILGYPLQDYRFRFDQNKAVSLTEQTALFTTLLQHYDISEETIKETFGIEVLKKALPEPNASGFGE